MAKNAAGERAQDWPVTSRVSPARPNVPRLLTIIVLALLAWILVIAVGFLGWSAISFLLGY